MNKQHPVEEGFPMQHDMTAPSTQTFLGQASSHLVSTKHRMRQMLVTLLALGLVTAFMPTIVLAASPTVYYEYDANGNLTKITDGLGHATVQQYDALNRLTQQQQPNPSAAGQLGTITTQYNAIDQVTGVTDPRSLTTSYSPNAFGNILNLTSPDTGATINTYDDAGNLKTKQDAKNQITTYSYDALNRLTQIQYADASLVNYSYDQGVNGAGHLTGITDSTGSITYSYDSLGHVTSEARTLNAITYTTTYAYNSAGQLTGVAYPTGLVITYTYDNLGRINQVSSTKNGQTQILASNIVYQPFGGLQSFSFGNGASYNRAYDIDGRLTAYSLGAKTINLSYDDASRITAATDSINSTDTKTYLYDNLDRLVSFIAPTTNQGYGYDLTGNRTNLTVGANSYSNTIAPTSNRLTAMTGPTPKSNLFDNNGSITTSGTNQFTYDVRGRLVQATTPVGNVTYAVNALGQRVRKTIGSISTIYHYDLQGQQIAETDVQGAVKQEVVYLGSIPLAVVQ